MINDKEIKQKLKEIEEKENVKILYCVESGSRAWGFASPDSDFDVRFIYVRPKEYYLRLDETRDVIEWQLDDVYDINGWDLKKALILAHKSNPTIFEWINSPIVYKKSSEWEKVEKLIMEYFQAKTTLYHYLHIAKRAYKENLLSEKVRLKKYFYALRPILACKWIIEKNSIPPILFSKLKDEYLDKNLINIVNELLILKGKIPELGEGERIDELNKYISESILEIEGALNSYKERKINGWEKLNNIFLEILNNNN